MSIVNIHDAKTHFSRLVDQAAAGEEIVIAKAGKPVARLMPLARPQRAKRRLGLAKGKLGVPDDFDRMFADEIEKLFGVRTK
ncbi:MAG: type II toxin-antitoxin system Phd/YefM family antitoxin [Burkholderiales bacterium]